MFTCQSTEPIGPLILRVFLKAKFELFKRHPRDLSDTFQFLKFLKGDDSILFNLTIGKYFPTVNLCFSYTLKKAKKSIFILQKR